VIQVLGPQSVVQLEGGLEVRCHLKKTVKEGQGLPVVGDLVLIDPPAHGMSRIVAIQPRQTVLRRPDVHRAKADQIIVSNVDQLIIVASIGAPPLRPELLDRYLVAAWKEGLNPVLCLTKCDYELEDYEVEDIQTFEQLELPVIYTSVVTGQGIEELLEQLTGKLSVFAGLSGVGKTSLARSLLRDETLAIGELSTATGLGKHTTTSARMLPLPDGRAGAIIDLPGQRVFGLSGLSPQDLARGFPELALIEPCALGSCSHMGDPGCSFPAALESGVLSERRFLAYLRLFASLETQLEESWR
jgi:ribosome biogenesis GTPase